MKDYMKRSLLDKTFDYMAMGKFFDQLVKKAYIRHAVDQFIGFVARHALACGKKVVPGRILFITFQGDYTCNPKYICEQLLADPECKDYQFIWNSRTKNMKDDSSFPDRVQKVEFCCANYYRALATAQVIVCNSVEFLKKPIKKRKGQYMIETWHGSLGIKRFDASVNSGKAWIKAAYRVGERSNYCISNSTFETDEVYRATFWNNPSTEILKYGHPRNDLLFDGYKEKRQKLYEDFCKQYGIRPGTKFILYGPTFRDDKNFEVYNIEYSRLLEAVKAKFGGDWAVLLRYHNTVRVASGKNGLNSNDMIFNVTAYPDMQELMSFSDIAITDYSSWIYDFVLMRKPGFIYAVDIEKYNNERGFYYPLETTPFAVATDNAELIKAIDNFDNEEYQKKIDVFLEGKGCFEDGHASERVAAKIKELMK